MIRKDEIDYLCIISAKETREKKKIIIEPHADYSFKILLLGDSEVGTIRITEGFKEDLFTLDSKKTLGVDFEIKDLTVDDKNIKLQIWDFSSEKNFELFHPIYVRGAKGAIFVCDVNNKSTLANIDYWLSIIKREIKDSYPFTILVVGLGSGLENERQISTEEGKLFAESKEIDGYIECCGETGDNNKDIFKTLVRLMIHKETGKLEKNS